MTGLAVDVLSAKSVVRRMESGRKPESAVSVSSATPVSTGWYTDLKRWSGIRLVVEAKFETGKPEKYNQHGL